MFEGYEIYFAAVAAPSIAKDSNDALRATTTSVITDYSKISGRAILDWHGYLATRRAEDQSRNFTMKDTTVKKLGRSQL